MNRLRRARTWLAENWRSTLLSADFILGLIVAGVVAAATFRYAAIRDRGADALLIEVGLGVAVLAVALTALSILVAFLGEDYVRVLRGAPGGVPGAITPYRIVSVVAGTATLVALIGAFAWGISPRWVQAITLGVASGLTVWSIVGTIQLVGITAGHGRNRARMPEIRDEFRRGVEERKRNSA